VGLRPAWIQTSLTNSITSRETDSEQHGSWSDCTDAQASLDPCWLQTNYVRFVMTRLIYWKFEYFLIILIQKYTYILIEFFIVLFSFNATNIYLISWASLSSLTALVFLVFVRAFFPSITRTDIQPFLISKIALFFRKQGKENHNFKRFHKISELCLQNSLFTSGKTWFSPIVLNGICTCLPLKYRLK
jgi:hypothetical protein